MGNLYVPQALIADHFMNTNMYILTHSTEEYKSFFIKVVIICNCFRQTLTQTGYYIVNYKLMKCCGWSLVTQNNLTRNCHPLAFPISAYLQGQNICVVN